MKNKRPKRKLANKMLSNSERTQAGKPYSIFQSKQWEARAEARKIAEKTK